MSRLRTGSEKRRLATEERENRKGKEIDQWLQRRRKDQTSSRFPSPIPTERKHNVQVKNANKGGRGKKEKNKDKTGRTSNQTTECHHRVVLQAIAFGVPPEASIWTLCNVRRQHRRLWEKMQENERAEERAVGQKGCETAAEAHKGGETGPSAVTPPKNGYAAPVRWRQCGARLAPHRHCRRDRAAGGEAAGCTHQSDAQPDPARKRKKHKQNRRNKDPNKRPPNGEKGPHTIARHNLPSTDGYGAPLCDMVPLRAPQLREFILRGAVVENHNADSPAGSSTRQGIGGAEALQGAKSTLKGGRGGGWCVWRVETAWRGRIVDTDGMAGAQRMQWEIQAAPARTQGPVERRACERERSVGPPWDEELLGFVVVVCSAATGASARTGSLCGAGLFCFVFGLAGVGRYCVKRRTDEVHLPPCCMLGGCEIRSDKRPLALDIVVGRVLDSRGRGQETRRDGGDEGSDGRGGELSQCTAGKKYE
ncbi:hypothetical protein C8J57DRAFT_1591714 [Mycena rebaudengoi]|nr:hypothetical protein C8J57DRAFT_1591714 [Mycena rebaudengoi]